MFWVQNYILSNSDQGSRKKNEYNFQKKVFHSDYQIFILLIKT